jgi:hypothetical protein
MAKAGMRRRGPGALKDRRDGPHRNKDEQGPVPEIQGKAKAGHEKARPL